MSSAETVVPVIAACALVGVSPVLAVWLREQHQQLRLLRVHLEALATFYGQERER